MDFASRFAAARTAENPLGLQILFFAAPELDAVAICTFLRREPEMANADVEIVPVAALAGAEKFLSTDGPPASHLGLIAWDQHAVKLAQFNEPMPYGPVESCVGPALLPPPMKVDAKQHAAHVLLFDAGTHPDVRERFAALCALAGALARIEGAICVLNEDARSACPAYDLIPDDGEDALATYRQLPIPYLLGGFVKLILGDTGAIWVRSFANYRLGLPELALKLADHNQTAKAFQMLAGIAGYLMELRETLRAGETLDLGDGTRYILREPTAKEDFLNSNGSMLVLEIGEL